jgi:hypothetical protein
MRKWLKEHGSAVYIGLLLILGLTGLVLGQWLGQIPNARSWGEFAIHLSGAIIAVGFTAVLFAIGDFRDSMAKVVADLFDKGGIIGHLTDASKRRLRKRLTEALCNRPDNPIDDSLYSHLDELVCGCACSFVASNYSHTKTLIPVKDNPDLLTSSFNSSYRITAPVAGPSLCSFPARYFFSWTVANDIAPKTTAEWVRRFRFVAGEKEFDLKAATVEFKEENGETTCTLKFEQKVEFQGHLDIKISGEVLASRLDPVESRIARYPTLGFNVRLNFEQGLAYDCHFFSSRPPNKLALKEWDVNKTESGITFHTNDWVLPGEGVMLYYYIPRSALTLGRL